MADEYDLGALLDLAQGIAVEAGTLVATLRRGHVGVASTKSSSHDIVTASDTRAEALVRERLDQARPDDGLLAEEGSRRPSDSGLTWVVDPIDGTVNYYYDIPWYAVSIGLTDAGGPLLGVVHNPATGETWTATRGGGAYLDGRRLASRTPVDLSQALVATGFGYSADRRAEQATVLSRLLPHVRDVRRMGAAALDLCSVATGRVDAYYERGLQPWDAAAGRVVASEAGVTVQPGLGPAADLLVAAPPPLYDALLAAVSLPE